MVDSSATFESHRPALLALAYRMLGEMARAEDVVQDAWVRWQGQVNVDSPKAFLLTTVARLCMDELGSARARREESRSDRLPEPVDLDRTGIGRVEMLDQISMAFMVLLQRLTPAERAVLLLHDVFDMSHAEIAALLGKSDAACRPVELKERRLKGGPAVVLFQGGRAVSAILVSVADGKVRHVFLHVDAERLSHVGPPN